MLLDALIKAGNFAMGVGDYFYDVKRQNIQYAREDNAVQRRVADLKAAGLSPVLAAGSAASSSPPISTQAPSLDVSPMDMLRMKNDVSRSDYEKQVMEEKAKQEKYITESVREKAKTDWMYYKTLNSPGMDGKAPILRKADADLTTWEAGAKRALVQAEQGSRELSFDVANEVYNSNARDFAASGAYVTGLLKKLAEGEITAAQFASLIAVAARAGGK